MQFLPKWLMADLPISVILSELSSTASSESSFGARNLSSNMSLKVLKGECVAQGRDCLSLKMIPPIMNAT